MGKPILWMTSNNVNNCRHCEWKKICIHRKSWKKRSTSFSVQCTQAQYKFSFVIIYGLNTISLYNCAGLSSSKKPF